MKSWTGAQRLLFALIVSSLLSAALYVVRVLHYDTTRYIFLNWNLFLAWLPLGFALGLRAWLRKNRWLTWQAILLTALWLGFLPNSFYLVSDMIHLQTASASSILYDTVMLLSFAWNGLILGFFSLYLVHQQLLKRLSRMEAHSFVGVILLLCSFAIYLGRYLRWSTWDVLVNPAGILFDVSDRIINPSSHPQTFTTTLTFFLLLSSMYLVIWQFVAASRSSNLLE